METNKKTLMSYKKDTLKQAVSQTREIVERWFNIIVLQHCVKDMDSDHKVPVNKQIFHRTSKIDEPIEGHMLTIKSIYLENGDFLEERPSVVFDVYDDYLEENFRREASYFTLEELLYLAETIEIQGYDPRTE